jgi:hypothetical protein
MKTWSSHGMTDFYGLEAKEGIQDRKILHFMNLCIWQRIALLKFILHLFK